jgi:23S rRNA (pseudouridine1915-N3)-methyltransferase
VKLVLISVGKPKTRGIAAAIADYESRLSHYFKFESLEVQAERLTGKLDRETVIERESAALLAKVPERSQVIALDERGSGWSSEELARYLEDLAVHGQPGAAFLVGGALGISESLRKRADHVLSLSHFTLPHELARLVMAEQLYRAGTILRGEPYHKAG